MRRSILKSLCLAAVVFAVPSRALAVWPPSTSLVVESEVSSTGAPAERLSPVTHLDVQTATNKLVQDESRLEKIIQDLKDDETVLKKLNQASLNAQGSGVSRPLTKY